MAADEEGEDVFGKVDDGGVVGGEFEVDHREVYGRGFGEVEATLDAGIVPDGVNFGVLSRQSRTVQSASQAIIIIISSSTRNDRAGRSMPSYKQSAPTTAKRKLMTYFFTNSGIPFKSVISST